MDDKKLYAAILGLTPPWGVEKVDLRLAQGEVLKTDAGEGSLVYENARCS